MTKTPFSNLNEALNTLIHSLYTDAMHITAWGIHTHLHALPRLDPLSSYTLGEQSNVQGVIQLSYAEYERWLVGFMAHHFSCSSQVTFSWFFSNPLRLGLPLGKALTTAAPVLELPMQ